MSAQTAKITPGLWGIDHEDDAIIISQPGKDGSVVAILRHAAGNEEQEANARLIAAAPELLEALRQIVTRYVELVNSGDCGSWNPEKELEVVDARSAIQHATGEQP